MRTFLVAMTAAALLAGCGDDESGSGGAGGGTTSASSSTGTSGNTTSTSTGAPATTSGGEGGEGGAGGAASIDVSVRFAVRVGDDDATCGTDYDLGVDGGDTQFEDLRFYVHDVRLVTSEGDEVPVELTQDGLWQVENVAMLDFEDGTGACVNGNAALNDVVVGSAPAGEYVGLKLRLGVPEELNHADVTSSPSPLDQTSLFWDWGFGHIFLAVATSSTPEDAEAPNEHFVHVGSTGCSGDPELDEDVVCTSPNRPEIAFDSFDIESEEIVLDATTLLEASHLGTELGCHSFPDTPACVSPFTSLGLDYETGEETPDTQSAFRVETQ